jgi:hypothetical protein
VAQAAAAEAETVAVQAWLHIFTEAARGRSNVVKFPQAFTKAGSLPKGVFPDENIVVTETVNRSVSH